jgi:rhodanese-related sulfurtransferase
VKDSVKSVIDLLVIFLGIFTLTLAGSVSPSSSAEFQHISPEELKKLMKSKGGFLVVDAQPKSAYEMGHIRGAVNLPWAKEIEGPVKLPRNKLLVIYCDCTHEEDSADLAAQLIEKWDYKSSDIKLLTGGWSGWLKLGYPIQKSKVKGK